MSESGIKVEGDKLQIDPRAMQHLVPIHFEYLGRQMVAIRVAGDTVRVYEVME